MEYNLSYGRKSKSGNKRRRPRFMLNKGAIWAIIIMGVVIFLLVLFVPRRDWCDTRSGAMELNTDISCAIIRDEQVISVEKYDHITYCVREGASVAPGDRIAYILKWGYSDDMLYSLLEIQAEIYEAQMAQMSGVYDTKLMELEDSITLVESELRDTMMLGTEGEILDIQLRLSELLTQRSDYLRQNVYATEELSNLYEEESLRQAQIEQWQSSIVSTVGGRVSFYLDGYESAINASKLEIISYDIVKKAINGASLTNATVESSRQLYRIVNDQVWYCAFTTRADKSFRLIEGEQYAIRFEGYSDEVFKGVAHAPKISGEYVINILEFNTDSGDFMNIRSLGANIQMAASGVITELDTVFVDEDGQAYVTLKSDEPSDGAVKIPVTVVCVDEEMCLIKPTDPTLSIYPGQTLEKPSTNNFSLLIDLIKEIF